MDKESVDHHYLPQFYLKKFCFLAKKRISKTYTYDKIHQKKIVPKSTKEICYEKHRNTLFLDEEKDVFIENSFSELEDIMSVFFKLTVGYAKVQRKKNSFEDLWHHESPY